MGRSPVGTSEAVHAKRVMVTFDVGAATGIKRLGPIEAKSPILKCHLAGCPGFFFPPGGGSRGRRPPAIDFMVEPAGAGRDLPDA